MADSKSVQLVRQAAEAEGITLARGMSLQETAEALVSSLKMRAENWDEEED